MERKVRSVGPNYYTAGQTKEILGGITDGVLYNYVKNGTLERIIPPGYRQGVYYKKQVDQLAHDINSFIDPEEEANATKGKLMSEGSPFEKEDKDHINIAVATIADLPECISLNQELFSNARVEDKKSILPLLVNKWTEWLQKNPEIVYILRKDKDLIGIITILPFKPNSDRIKRVLVGDTSILLGNVDISPEDIEEYKDGNHVQLYIAGIGIKQGLDKNVKRKYGARLISQPINIISSLGERGIVIEEMIAVGATQSGIRLLQHFGFCEVISSRDDTRMFKINMTESGAPIATAYRKALKERNV